MRFFRVRAKLQLADIQRAIAGVLFQPLTRHEGMQRAGAAVAVAFIRPNDRLTGFERLQIYNQQFIGGGCTERLGRTFAG